MKIQKSEDESGEDEDKSGEDDDAYTKLMRSSTRLFARNFSVC